MWRVLGHRIVPAGMQGLALQDSLDGQPEPANRSVFFDRLHCIVRAGWIEPASITHQRRDGQLVNADWQDKQFAKHASILSSNEPLDN